MSQKSRDSWYEEFIEQIDEPDASTPVPSDVIDSFRGRLPAKLLEYWSLEGWCGFGRGKLWTVDPRDYADVLKLWIEGTPLAGEPLHVIARSAFGKLFLCSEVAGPCGDISCASHSIYVTPRELKPRKPDAADSWTSTILIGLPEDSDFKNDNGKPMFATALKKLGATSRDTIYGFQTPLIKGGQWRVANLQIVEWREHLRSLRAVAEPRLPMFER